MITCSNCGKIHKNESSCAKMFVSICDNCNICESNKERSKEFRFCCTDCLIEFTGKKALSYVLRLKKGK